MSDTPRTKAAIEAIEKDGGNHNIRDYYQSLQVYAEQQERELAAMTKERDQLKARVTELKNQSDSCTTTGIPQPPYTSSDQ